MTDQEFRRLVAATKMDLNGRTTEACRLVLVGEKSAYAAAKEVGVDLSGVGRALKKLSAATPVECCPTCGSAI